MKMYAASQFFALLELNSFLSYTHDSKNTSLISHNFLYFYIFLNEHLKYSILKML